MAIQQTVAIFQLFGTAVAAAALIVTALQLRRNYRATQGQFLLSLDDHADRYDAIYYRLRSTYDAGVREEYKLTDDELLRAKEYMGFLEHAEVLIELGSISLDAFDDLFGHRVRALAANEQIMFATIRSQPHRWRRFLKLLGRLKVVPCSQTEGS